ncbi:MAG: hypothetical protein R6V15_16045 [Desulfotignum sp.]
MFIIGVLFGVIVGWGGVWYFTVGKDNQKVQETEERVAAQIEETTETVTQVLQAKLAEDPELSVFPFPCPRRMVR